MKNINVKNEVNTYYYQQGEEWIKFPTDSKVEEVLERVGRLVPTGATTKIDQAELDEILGEPQKAS